MKSNSSLLFLALSAILVSCVNNNETDSNKKQSDKIGGTFAMSEVNEIKTIFPLSLSLQTEGLIVSQIHEGLVRLNPKTLEAVPGIADKWEISADGKMVTFHLNKDAYFQDDKCFSGGNGTKITSEDIKFTFELLATKADYNYQFDVTLKDRLVGATEFYNKKIKSLTGFKIIDDVTFTLELEHPSLSFLQLLADPSASIISKTAFEAYGTELKIGAGPFKYDISSTFNNIVLVKNKTYHGKDSLGYALPYLDTVLINIYPSIEEGLQNYENGKIDLVNMLPSLRVKDIVEANITEFQGTPPKTVLQHEAEMVSHYYSFNFIKPPYNNIKVRQAINYAIDREKIVNNVLQGQAIGCGIYGITPNTFSGYDIKAIKGYSLDIPKAKKLLAEAGFPGAIGFPEIQLVTNSGNSRNSSVAVDIQKQLKENLNINVSFESLPYAKKHELELLGKGDIFRDAWVAEYSSPEAFLRLFVGKNVPTDPSLPSYPNTSRYNNPKYDELFFKGKNSNNKDTAYAYFMKAEQLMINDAAIIPLWYEGVYRLISNKVKNLHLNPMRYYDFTTTYKIK